MSLLDDLGTYVLRIGGHRVLGQLVTPTIQIADASILTPPILPPSALVGGFITAQGGGEFAVFCAQSNAVGGSLITDLVICEDEEAAGPDTNTFSLEIQAKATPTSFSADASTVAAQEFGGAAITGTFLMGTVPTGQEDKGAPCIQARIQPPRSIYIPTGQQLKILHIGTSNDNLVPSFCFKWQEFTVAL